MRRFHKRTSLLLLISLVLSSVTAPINAHASSTSAVTTKQTTTTADDEEQGLRFRLSQAPDQPEAQPTSKAAPTTMLSDAETANVLRRLAPIKAEAPDQQEFALRERSLPPPRTGKTITVSFPAAENAAATNAEESGPLEVLRYSPEGEVPLAPNLSVTFSQPMIAISSQEEAAEIVPVRLSPQPPGKWRWVGTKTLLFEPDGRFPMATTYSVTVPAGTKSATGGALANTKTWNFTTPPPTIKNAYPKGDDTQARDALMFIEFDQHIDPAVVLHSLSVTANQRFPLTVRLATDEETQAAVYANFQFAMRTGTAKKGNWLAFRAIEVKGGTALALPRAARISVSINPGTGSAEGPATTSKAQTFSFRTYGGLRVTRHECARPCAPYEQWTIEFSNTLDQAAFQESQVRIEPRFDGQKTMVYGNTLSIEGAKRGHTTYTVTLDGGIKDKFGQTLGRNETVTFYAGASPRQLFAPGGSFLVLDPAGPANLPIYSTNHAQLKVRLYSVTPPDWTAWIDYSQPQYNSSSPRTTPPGRLVYAKTISVKGAAPDEMVETRIDLQPALTNDLGQMILLVEPQPAPRKRDGWEPVTVASWIQRTKIGLDAFADRTDLITWVTALSDGRPLKDVQLTVQPYGFTASSGADGMARIPLGEELSPRVNVLVARQGDDVAILPEHTDESDRGDWFKREADDTLRWYVFDDRKLYRPGEEVHIKGWIRRIGGDKLGDVGLPVDDKYVTDLVYTLKDSTGNEIKKAATKVNALGGFDLVLKLPETMNLGDANLELLTNSNLSGSKFSHKFQVHEFRRPEFEVAAKAVSEGPFFVRGNAELSVSANYFAGGGLPNAPVYWSVTATPAGFTPPNRGDYTFGRWTPWWIESRERTHGHPHTESFAAHTDATGKQRLHIDFDSINPPQPTSITAQASVTDVNRQTWTSTTTVLVHPANLYVGLKSDKTFVQPGEPLVAQSIVTDLDGKAIANREVTMRAELLDWQQVKGEWEQVAVNPQDCSTRSGADAVQCTFAAKEGGMYRVTATVQDDQGRKNESELTLWVAGGKQPPTSGVAEEKVELIPDAREYHAGDTAELLVQAPFYPAEAVLTLRRSGIVRTERFGIDGPSYTLRVPIAEAWMPNIHLQVDLVGATDRDGTESRDTGTVGVPPADSTKTQLDPKQESPARSVRAGALTAGGTPAVPVKTPAVAPKRPAFASGEINLSIAPIDRKLTVTATPREKALEPGAETVVNIEARAANGNPISGGEVAVIVVDESVLALTNYKLDDPLAIFYAPRNAETSDYHSRANLLLARSLDSPFSRLQLMAELQEGGGGPGGGGGGTVVERLRSIDVRGLGGLNDKLSLGKARVHDIGSNNGTIITTKSGDAAAENESIRLRENFNALAVFAPAVRTDANGHAQVQVKLPDNLTRYRVMAVAVAGGKQFGMGESAITARLPLMARPSAPRFLNFGDRFELPIVVQNQTDAAITVDLAVRATNAQLITGTVIAGTAITGTAGVRPASGTGTQFSSSTMAANEQAGGTPAVPVKAFESTGRRVTVPANDRVEVRIPATTEKAGTARFQIAAVSGRWSDAAEVELPVWTPATSEAFATYGEIDDGAIRQPVQAPANVFKQFGGLEIETSSTQLQQLTDAFLYLQSYPYECSEQLSSRIISVAALRDVLTAFKVKDLPKPKEIEAAVTRDLKRLQGMQNADGGFGFWQRGNLSWPYLSIHVAHALARARQKKFDVPKEMFEQSQKYLREIESHIPAIYGTDTRRAIIAYALYVRTQMGDPDLARARKLIAEAGLEKLSLESVGWLLSVLSKDKNSLNEVLAMRHLLNNRVTETAGTAHFVCSYNDSDYLLLNSDRRADGIILEALVGDQPTSDLIPKIVRGLLDHRTRGRWENTQENVFILLALDRYFNAFEKVTPNFVARVWLGDAYAGEQQFKGRSTDRQRVNVPMSYLVDKATDKGFGKDSAAAPGQNLILSKEGPGRLYYRIGMNYAPLDLNLKAADYGFTVARTYEALDHSEDVRQGADGTWHIKAGARVRVRLTMVAPARRYHVALVDPLPAGFETLNPVLATSETIPEDKQQSGVSEYGNRSYGVYGWWSWRSVWFDHQNLRDERAEAFSTLLWEGVYNYAYVARATTPGMFVAPPAKAEEMYHPETFGRGKTDRVVIE